MTSQAQPASCSADELRALFLFEKLSDPQLAWLCREGRVEVFPPGPVYAEGDPATCFYVLLSGTLVMSRKVGGDDVETNRTSAPGVYAAGDVASAWHPHYSRYVRVEHWFNALNQGLTAGANAAGGSDRYTHLPYFFSDQYDLGMEYVGFSDPTDAVAVRGSLADREFISFWHRDGIVTAAMNVNVWDVVEDLKAIVAGGRRLEPSRLADPDVALADLA
jgi:NADPH-dependent 2,4-dienoyl-CoA reductase/sulfur reductase-like enzyme